MSVDLDHGQHARGRGKRDFKKHLTEFAAASVGILLEKFYDHRVELHQACVLPQVVLRFAEEAVASTVAVADRDLARLLQRAHHQDLVVECCIRERG